MLQAQAGGFILQQQELAKQPAGLRAAQLPAAVIRICFFGLSSCQRAPPEHPRGLCQKTAQSCFEICFLGLQRSPFRHCLLSFRGWPAAGRWVVQAPNWALWMDALPVLLYEKVCGQPRADLRGNRDKGIRADDRRRFDRAQGLALLRLTFASGASIPRTFAVLAPRQYTLSRIW